MKSINETEFNHFIHSVRNPLNSIALHAELGKMLMDGRGSSKQIKNAFEVILQQCRLCDQTMADMRLNANKSDE
jgi:signal transduction histidine kinase